MFNIRWVGLIAVVFLMAFGVMACTQSRLGSLETGRGVAEEFMKQEATYRFDGMPETLKVTEQAAAGEGWKYTIEFDSRHAGYGNRSGQALDMVITRHRAEITVQNGRVTQAIMDQRWDMINQRLDAEIKPAPIDEVRVYTMESNPPQIGVYIKGGLPDGCTSLHDIQTTREGNTVNIKVTVQRPRGVSCPAIYTYFEKYVNLGTDFAFGTTFTLKVNDYTTTFSGTLMQYEGFAIYLTRDDIPPDKMEMLSHVQIADRPVISSRDIITYNAQTHEIKLTDQAFARISQLKVPVRGESFLVCVDRAPVYWGAFWTPLSSMSFSGVTIWKPMGSPEPKVITLELGYPSASFYQGTDPRNNPVVLHALERSGKLIEKLTISTLEKLPAGFKGYELYSWLKDDRWHFTLITGTNRTKTGAEITSGEDYISETGWVKIRVVGVEALKTVLGKLPRNESVCWCDELHTGPITGTDLTLPPGDIVEKVREWARQYGLELMVSFDR